MLETLRHFDHYLFHCINSDCANRFLDFLCPILRDKNTWIPFYIIAALLLISKYKVEGIKIVVAAALTLLISDQLSSHVIKPFFHRLRPCNSNEILIGMRLLVDCGNGFSFVSSHASNHFALAFFFGIVFRKLKWLMPLLIVWAVSIGFSQIYVGVHYPLDVVAGALFGILIGGAMAILFKSLIKVG